MRESRTYGSGRGARDETRVPTATGVDGPLAASEWQTGVSKNHQEREPSMSEITTIGLDLAKHVFQVHGIPARVHHAARRRGGVAARGALAATGDAHSRVRQDHNPSGLCASCDRLPP